MKTRKNTLVETLLTYEEASKLLNVSMRKLENLVARREIDHIKSGRHVRFLPEHIQGYIKRNTICARTGGT